METMADTIAYNAAVLVSTVKKFYALCRSQKETGTVANNIELYTDIIYKNFLISQSVFFLPSISSLVQCSWVRI